MNALAESLLKCRVEGNVLFLPPMEEGPLENYQEVRKALLNAGAKYKRNTFVFDGDAQPYIDRLISGESVNIKKEFQFFPTPQDIAEMMISYLPPVPDDARILEPSAGDGALIKAFRAAYPNTTVECFELMEINRKKLEFLDGAILRGDDFLKSDYKDLFDIIIANPPFTNNQDIDHITKMYEALKPGGTIITLSSPSWTFGSQKKQIEFKEWLERLDVFPKTLPQKSFASSGTMITPVLLQIQKPKIEMISSSGTGIVSGAAIPGPNETTTIEHQSPQQIIEDIKKSQDEINTGLQELSEMVSNDLSSPERKCRVCGCTQNDCRQCIEATGQPCHWVDQDLCSACVQIAFENFQPTMLKLQENPNSVGEDWWRSRWHDWVDPKADDPEFDRKHQLQIMWPHVWEMYREQFSTKVPASTNPPVPDAYQAHVEKVLSQPKFTEMKFFEQLNQVSQGVDIALTVKAKNGKLTVMILPRITGRVTTDPIIVTNTPENLDKFLFEQVGHQVMDCTSALLKEVEKAVAKSDTKLEEKKESPEPSNPSPAKKRNSNSKPAAKKGSSKSASGKNGASKKPKQKAPPKKQAKVEDKPKVVEQSMF